MQLLERAILYGIDCSALYGMQVKGRGGHAALPHLSNDPVVAAAAIIVALQSLVSRETVRLSSPHLANWPTLECSFRPCSCGCCYHRRPTEPGVTGDRATFPSPPCTPTRLERSFQPWSGLSKSALAGLPGLQARA